MKGRPIDQLVYECMFSKPKSGDPQNFHDLLRRQLVPEVRNETASFYGGLDSREAQYPGLDYSFSPHRMRLSRYTWHRRLFRAFDTLRLTPSEIAGLTKWEGTRWAKERFEKEQGINIRDTTGDCIHDWVDPELRRPTGNIQLPPDVEVEQMEDVEEEGDTEDIEEDGDESDMEIDSVGLDLNERLRAAAALREAGVVAAVMDEEWEQWLKDAAEAGGITSEAGLDFLVTSASPPEQEPTTLFAPRSLSTARARYRHQFYDSLQDLVRQNIQSTNLRPALHTSVSQTATSRREAPVSGRVSLGSINASSSLSNQQRQSRGSTLRRTSLSRTNVASGSTPLAAAWQPNFQQQPQS